MKRVAARSLLLVSALSMLGCGTSGSSARATLHALVSATRAPDPARALYDLMPESARRAESLDAFRARVGSDPRSLGELRDAVAAALSGATPVTVELRQGARRVLAVEERDGWRVGGPSLGDATVVTTPGRDGARAALEHLRRTLARGDLQGLMSMLSARARGAMESDLRDLAAALEDPDALQFPEVPGATRVRLPDGRVLLLVWERDGWRVEGLRENVTP
ncbi:MAG: hypothetical protein EPO40_20415 [Myxococcaceae bacterium]|nr:MAG: hypothetical protein EPO40_20415 [Myxococcaceae bacterium]